MLALTDKISFVRFCSITMTGAFSCYYHVLEKRRHTSPLIICKYVPVTLIMSSSDRRLIKLYEIDYDINDQEGLMQIEKIELHDITCRSFSS